ncbi:MAG: hypothetical protein R3F19_16060 [Verrucomicrobiales bacterium]
MQDEESHSTPPPDPVPEDQTPPALPANASPWSERKGKGMFWCLLFAPALVTLTALAGSIGMKGDSPGGLFASAGLGIGICVYCGMWLASGFQLSTAGKVFAGLGLALAFAFLNGVVFFAGCFAVLTFQ